MFGPPGGGFGGDLFSFPQGDLFSVGGSSSGGGRQPFGGGGGGPAGGPPFGGGGPPKGKAPAGKAVKYETLYHGTNGEWAGSIGKKGLIPSTNGRLGPGVYLTPNKDAAWRWAKWNEMPYVLTCKVPSDEITERATHPGYPERDMPPFSEVVVPNGSAVEITHVRGIAFVDHAVKEMKQPGEKQSNTPTAPSFKPTPPDPAGSRSSQCHLRDVWKRGGSGARCPKCCAPLALNGQWVCKTCGKCWNCQPYVPDPSVKRSALVEAGLHHFVSACDEQKAEDNKTAAAAAAAAKAEARAKAAEESVAKAAADAAAKAVAKAVANMAVPPAAPPVAPSAAAAAGRGRQVTRHLAEHSLEQYSARLIGEGYDDLEDLLSMSQAELEHVAEGCGMKPGHRRRLLKACGHLGAVSVTTDVPAPEPVAPAPAPAPAMSLAAASPTAAADQWACSACTYRNDVDARQCCMCDTMRAERKAEPAAPAGPSGRAQEDPIVIDGSDDDVDEPTTKRAKVANL